MKKKKKSKKSVLGQIIVSRDIFIETIAAIENQFNHDQECTKAFNTILPHDFISGYDNHWLSNQLIKFLQIAMNDEHKDSWIEYYIWELDFGKKYKQGCASRKNDSNIDLSGAGTLYDFLMEE